MQRAPLLVLVLTLGAWATPALVRAQNAGDLRRVASELHGADASVAAADPGTENESGTRGDKGRRNRRRHQQHGSGQPQSGNRRGGHGGNHPERNHPETNPSTAAPEADSEATSTDALLALGLAAGLGAAGGLLLRTSSER